MSLSARLFVARGRHVRACYDILERTGRKHYVQGMAVHLSAPPVMQKSTHWDTSFANGVRPMHNAPSETIRSVSSNTRFLSKEITLMNRACVKAALFCLLVVAMVFGQGCASIVSKSTYDVTISSTPSNVRVDVYNKKGELKATGSTPLQARLKAGAGYFSGEVYTVEFKRDGYPVHKAQIERGVDGWYIVGNLFFGGLVGWLIVDPLTGAMWTLKDLHVDLEGTAQADLNEPGALRIVSLDQVPRNLQPRMVRIN